MVLCLGFWVSDFSTSMALFAMMKKVTTQLAKRAFLPEEAIKPKKKMCDFYATQC